MSVWELVYMYSNLLVLCFHPDQTAPLPLSTSTEWWEILWRWVLFFSASSSEKGSYLHPASDPLNNMGSHAEGPKIWLFVWNFQFHIVWENSEGSCVTVWMGRLAWAFAVCPCNKKLFYMNWPSLFAHVISTLFTWVGLFWCSVPKSTKGLIGPVSLTWVLRLGWHHWTM